MRDNYVALGIFALGMLVTLLCCIAGCGNVSLYPENNDSGSSPDRWTAVNSNLDGDSLALSDLGDTRQVGDGPLIYGPSDVNHSPINDAFPLDPVKVKDATEAVDGAASDGPPLPRCAQPIIESGDCPQPLCDCYAP